MNKYNLHNYVLGGCLALALLTACDKDDSNDTGSSLPDPVVPPVASTLKEAASFPVGAGIGYNLLLNDPKYASTVAENFNSLTFEYALKQGAVVQSDGTYNFSKVDQLVNYAAQHDMRVHGHTLVWYQNNNGTYLRALVAGNGGTSYDESGENLLANGGFEEGDDDSFTYWSAFNGATAFSAATAPDVKEGTRALKVTVTADNPGNQWKVQLASDKLDTEVGKAYKVSFWIKAAQEGGLMRLSTQPTASYQGDQTIGTTWTQVIWTFTAQDAQTQLLFDMGAKADTYYIDEVTVREVSISGPVNNPAAAAAVDKAMKDYITAAMTRYKGKIKAWDVVNEAITDNTGQLRTNPNPGTPTTGDTFYWAEFLGEDYIAKAFQYAHEADPTAKLFLNDYNQEADGKKLNAFVALVSKLKTQGVPIDGVGLQMHISVNTPNSGIEEAIRQMASTGLLVHISELDVRTNPSNSAAYTFTPGISKLQGDKVQFVIDAYQRLVPAAQQYGLTFWNVTDKDSWIVQQPDHKDNPTLFDANYGKKDAYFSALKALLSK
ncbi:endo-1,4-beta-xylanase [Pontibacter chitinilyticus]|uniref:endo-1,4-beta-xylanase n=1 Tax=Pontibacter chitinilyticus TaxID=2674989 RepID=UPI00321AA29D